MSRSGKGTRVGSLLRTFNDGPKTDEPSTTQGKSEALPRFGLPEGAIHSAL